ncbi:MAG: hypothetical protein BWY19_00338 [bacterium ADurb.Bin212]|nr:MAG: hypothetical protein BWY19_00338 [bacterium ADurb.Bin212]
MFTLVILGGLFVYQNAYAGKIYKNIHISGIDVSGKTKKQAEMVLDKKFASIGSKNVIFVAGEKHVSSKLSETGLSFDVDKSVSQAYSIGRSHKFFPQLYASAKTSVSLTDVEVPVSIDNTKLNLFISEKLPELNVEPINASITIDQNGAIIITPEQVGQQVDTSNLAQTLSQLVSLNQKSYEIKLHAIATDSAINSQMLLQQKSQAEKYINSSIQLTYEDKIYTPSRLDISKWIVFSGNVESLTVSLDENAIKSYLSIIAKNFEINKKDRKVNALDGAIIEEGQQGKYLDKNKASEMIVKAIESGSGSIALSTYTKDPEEIKVFPSEGIVPGRFEGKYIDVDLTQQKLCQIEGNVVLNCYIVSSGKASTPTPVGTRYIQSKHPKAWSAPYGLYMPWWQALGGGYGLHELPEWPNGYKEGESHLGTPVSHGCVRLGVGAAEAVYNWTDIGTPVYIHK